MKLRSPLKTLRNQLRYATVLLILACCALAENRFQNLYKFTGGNDGWAPLAGLVSDANGDMYGTTVAGGDERCGTVFELLHGDGAWSEKVLYSFTCGSDGTNPEGGLVFDQAGNLYGTTFGEGTIYGNVFELVRKTGGNWSLKVLHSFTGGSDGAYPMAGLAWDQAGNLYGTTTRGGASGLGLVFQLRPSGNGSWKEKVLHPFAGGSDGEAPNATLTFDSGGGLYGTTIGGGGAPPCACGTVFQLTPKGNGSWKYGVIHRFRGTDGQSPFASVTLDAEGNLYSTTSTGGPKGAGTVFELIRGQNGSWVEKSLHNFGLNPLAGLAPWTGLLLDASGNLWGTTIAGGNLGCDGGGCGVVFELTPDSQGSWKESVVHTFLDNPGYYPGGTLISDTAGNLYGTTEGDGDFTFGSIYEITP